MSDSAVTEVVPSPVAVHQARYRGESATLMAIHVVNLLLTMLTAGFYYFWGKARLQSYIYGQLEFAGARFAYLGTGKEFFRGWRKVIGFVVAILVVQFLVELNDKTELQLWGLVYFYAILLVISPLAIVGIRRFRMSRTAWRGIRFSFRGNTRDFMKVFMPGAILTALTCGLYYPYFAVKTKTYLVEHTYIGRDPFRYDGRGGDLFGPCVKGLLLAPPSFGLAWLGFHARKVNYDWAHTTFRGARFQSNLDGAGLFGLWFSNAVLLLLTLGLAWPWAQVRSLEYQLQHLTLVGEVDWDAITLDGQDGDATGEQLGELMGTSMFDGGFA